MAEPLSGICLSIISSLLYDGGKKLINRNSFEKIYKKALTKYAKDLTKSDQIKEAIQGKKLNELVEGFELRGKLVRQSDLEEIFYPIFGETTNIFVRGFWSQLLHEISQDQKLDNEYKNIVQDHMVRLLEKSQEKESVYQSAGLRQVVPLPTDYVDPATSFQKVKAIFENHKACLIYGPPGSGKSILAATIAKEKEKEGNVFWLEFQPHQVDAKLVQKEVERFLFDEQKNGPKNWLGLLQTTKSFYVFDNLHYVKNNETLQLLQTIANALSRNNNNSLLLLTSREQRNELVPPLVQSFSLHGLDQTEATELITEKWQLPLNQKTLEHVLKTLNNHPQYLLFFKQWLEAQERTQHEIESYLQNAATNRDESLENYLASQLYEAFGGGESDTNKLLKAVSFWRLPESKEFIEQFHKELDGKAFNDTLRDLVKRKSLVAHQPETDTYVVHDILRQFYYQRTDELKHLHKLAADLYNERLETTKEIVAHLETAHHFRKADLFEESANAILPITHFCTTHGNFWAEVKELLIKLPIDKFKQKKQSQCWFALGGLCLSTGEWEKAEKYYKKTIIYFEQNNDLLGLAQTYGNLSAVYHERGEWKKAIEFCNATLEINIEFDDNSGMAKTYNNLGLINQAKGSLDDAIEFYYKAMKIAGFIKDIQLIAQINNNLGTVHLKRGLWNEAIEFYHKSLSGKKVVGDKHGIAITYGNLGNIYYESANWAKAIEHYEKSISTHSEIGDVRKMAQSLNNLGLAYQKKHELIQAIDAHNRAKSIFSQLGDVRGIAQTDNHLGLIFQNKGEWRKAIELHKNAKRVFEKVGDTSGLAATFKSLGIVYQRRNEPDKATIHYHRSLKLNEQLGVLKEMAEIYNNLGLIQQSTNNIDKAASYFSKSVELKEEMGDKYGLAQTYGNLALIACQQNNFIGALVINKKIQIIFVHFHDQFLFDQTSKNIDSIGRTIGKDELNRQNNIIETKLKQNGVKLSSTLVVSAEEAKAILEQMQKQKK